MRDGEFKARGYARFEERLQSRRESFVARLSENRAAVARQLRLLHDTQSDEGKHRNCTRGRGRNADAEEEGKKKKASKKKEHRLVPPPLMLPDWMVAIPHELTTKWFARVRPDGKHAMLVVTRGGRATIRNKNGRLLREPFLCAPLAHHKGNTVLDVVVPYAPYQHVIHALDVLVWNGHDLHDCQAEFRLHWLVTELEQLEQMQQSDDDQMAIDTAIENASPKVVVQLKAVLYDVADRSCVAQLYADATGAQNGGVRADGLLFYRVDASYSAGFSPMVLQWKDENCSAVAIETLPEPPPSDAALESLPLVVALNMSPELELYTSDEPSIKLGTINEAPHLENESLDAEEQFKDDDKDGCPAERSKRFKLLNWELLNVPEFLEAEQNEPFSHAAVFKYHSQPSKVRSVADCYSRVLFQCRLRLDPLSIHSILEHSDL